MISEPGSPHYDVIIVGYGPVGATLANLLGQEGFRVAVFERESSVYHQPRASHIDAECMRVYQSVGLAQTLEAVMISTKGTEFINQDGKLLLELKRHQGVGPLGWDHHYRVYQPLLEETLREGVSRFRNVDVFLSHHVIELESNEEQVTIKVESLADGGLHQYTAKFAVGCDGARSMVRHTMGHEMEDLGFHQPWLVIDVRLRKPLDLPDNSIQFCNPRRPMTYVPKIGSEDRYRWEIMLMPGDVKEEMERRDEVWELISPWVNDENARIERAAIYTFHSLLAADWRSGRLLIAGDAAHQMPPFLGQGMCAGIRDVSNLSWKLSMILRQQAPPELLDTYAAEREPHVRKFIEMSMNLGRLITARTPEEVKARDEHPPQAVMEPTPPLGKGLHRGLEPPAGTVFPQPRMPDGRLLDDVIGGVRFAVIGQSSAVEHVSEEVKQLWQQVGAVTITELCPEIEAWLAQHNAIAVIVRPDRYVLSAAGKLADLEIQTLTSMQFHNGRASSCSL